MTKSAVIEAVRQWPIEDQLHFVEQIWEEITVSNCDPQLSAEQKLEFQKRLHNYRLNPEDSMTPEQLITHLRRIR
ncbi:addiction module protein [Telmatocola sphagniphila]|jgi:putative addiction module component (TIGR02574 family)|uniref:Addiction module protein n=1 Tax=Telmatocola sphagniphila TaxID=1123043 RepID=A0A8E6B4J8_9BACT|nr:addiction module protein [Telmatocola sphagniphila]